MGKIYPPEVHEYVRSRCRVITDRCLAEECNERFGTEFTKMSLRSFRRRNGYLTGRRKGKTREEYWQTQTKWPCGMLDFIKKNARGKGNRELTEAVNREFGTSFSIERIKSFKKYYRISSGITGYFKKGHIPATKGKRMEEFCSPEAMEQMRKGQFKKSHVPHNTRPIGTVGVDYYGYLRRKKQEKGTQYERWELLHRAVWEEHNGPIPEGMIVIFKDGNRQNLNIDNLMLIARNELAQINKQGLLRSGNPELTETAINVIRLKKAVKDRRKRRNENEDNA